MIYLDSVTKIYKTGEESLKDITLNIDKGEFVSIVGFSGAGKTTLLELILGEIKPTKGSVYFNSVNISKLNQTKLNRHRRNIGTIFQDFRLIYNKNIYENVAFAMEVAGKSNEDVKKTVPHVLKLVGLENKGKRYPNELSGGKNKEFQLHVQSLITQM